MLTIRDDTPIEETARIMVDNKVVGPEQEKLRALVEPLVLRLADVRTC